jgi:protein ImuB
VAERGGLVPGLPLADARARVPELETAAHDPAGDARALAELAAWCDRYTPWVAVDGSASASASASASGGSGGGGCDWGGAAGLLLDVTGCCHFFGKTEPESENALLADLVTRLARRGVSARAALAETPGAAWALARFAALPPARPWIVVPPGGVRAALAPLPPAALRLAPEAAELLERLGLRRLEALFELPPAALAPRVGPGVARRLAQALGAEPEPISPRRPVSAQLVRRVFAEPIVAASDIARALEGLLAALCRDLEAAGLGARRLELAGHRVDGGTRRLRLGTGRPNRDPAHLARLFAPQLERLDPGFGIEVMTLAATATQELSALQLVLAEAGEEGAPGAVPGAVPGAAAGENADPELAELIDRLNNRLGPGSVSRPAPRASHVPERAVAPAPALRETSAAWDGATRDWGRDLGGDLGGGPAPGSAFGAAALSRPLRLLPRPEPVEAVALLPDHPPARFRWRRLGHEVARAEGPERIEPEWWHPRPDLAEQPARDYFRVEVTDGRRYWLYRADGDWFLHGVFG